MKKILFINLFIFLLIGNLFSSNAKLDVSFDKDEIILGDQVYFNITASFNGNGYVLFPLFKDTLNAHIEIINNSIVDSVISKDIKKYIHKTLITSFDSGYYVVESFPVLFVDYDNNDTLLLYTPKIGFGVSNVLLEQTTEIKDIKNILKSLPLNFVKIFLYTLLGLLILALILTYFIYNHYFKIVLLKKSNKYFEKSINPLEEFKNLLELIETEQLWTKLEENKKYYIFVSDGIRRYLERKYNFQALEMTTYEILEQLVKIKFQEDKYRLISSILKLSDLVKFAKYKTNIEENKIVLEQIKDLYLFMYEQNRKQILEEQEKKKNK